MVINMAMLLKAKNFLINQEEMDDGVYYICYSPDTEKMFVMNDTAYYIYEHIEGIRDAADALTLFNDQNLTEADKKSVLDSVTLMIEKGVLIVQDSEDSSK